MLSAESGSRKSFHRQWLTRDQRPSVPARHKGGRSEIEALRRTCEVCRSRSAPRQRQTPMKFARSFQRSIKRLSAGSFIATQPSVARRGSIGRSARQNNANRHLGQSCGRIEIHGRMLVRLIGLQRDLVFQPSARLVPPAPLLAALWLASEKAADQSSPH